MSDLFRGAPMTPLYDTHAHLAASEFDGDRGEVIEAARVGGVHGILSVSESLEDLEKNLRIFAHSPGPVRIGAGLHPDNADEEQARRVIEYTRLNRSSIAAIGEVGLDFWHAQTGADRELQLAVFERFIALALELNLPLNVHSRSAGRVAIERLIAKGGRKVQMHAFDGRAAVALVGVEAGFLFSVPPSVVRSLQKQKLVRRLPLSSLMLESDSPVLGPEPGERNTPANLRLVVEAVVSLKHVTEAAVIEAVADNTRRLYGDLWRATDRPVA